MKDSRQITPAEFQILEVLWDREPPQSVGQVLKELRRERELAYTTVMTLLDKLARKGSVARHREGKAYLYRPVVHKAEVLDWLIQEFADNFCGGQPTQLAKAVQAWAGDPPPSASTPSRSQASPEKKNRPHASRSPSAPPSQQDHAIDVVLL